MLLRNNFAHIRPLLHADTCLQNIACRAASLWDGALLPYYLGALFYITVQAPGVKTLKLEIIYFYPREYFV